MTSGQELGTELVKMFNLPDKCVSVSIHADAHGAATLKAEFIITDEQTEQLLATLSKYKMD
jgi:hypothetical protein